jgi:hypothetical protein
MSGCCNESCFSFLFCKKRKNSADKKSVPKCREETRLVLLSVPPEKFPDCFQSVRQSYLISLYHMRACDIAFVACDITFIACVACYIAFIACVACDIACVASVACNKCNIAFFVSSIFIQCSFLTNLFIPHYLR